MPIFIYEFTEDHEAFIFLFMSALMYLSIDVSKLLG